MSRGGNMEGTVERLAGSRVWLKTNDIPPRSTAKFWHATSNLAPESLLRTHVLAYGLAVRPWRTQGCLLYLVALLHLPFFFRFDVLVTVHLYDPP
jgi:hypothetical protein